METIQPFVNSGITFRIYNDRELAAEEANLALEAVNQQVVIYTDGSSSNGRIGAAIAIPLHLH